MSDKIWQRLADALDADVGDPLLSHSSLRSICRKLAAEDAEHEGREAGVAAVRAAGCKCADPLLGQRGIDGHARCRLCNVEAAPPAALAPLDPALVEECLQLFYKHGGGVSSHAGGVSMDAALTHYRERVEVPLRELAEQRREALEYERGETRRAADASAFYQREADRLRGELAEAMEDTVRLEWLEANAMNIDTVESPSNFQPDPVPMWVIWPVEHEPSHYGPTLRVAIDAARAREEK